MGRVRDSVPWSMACGSSGQCMVCSCMIVDGGGFVGCVCWWIRGWWDVTGSGARVFLEMRLVREQHSVVTDLVGTHGPRAMGSCAASMHRSARGVSCIIMHCMLQRYACVVIAWLIAL